MAQMTAAPPRANRRKIADLTSRWTFMAPATLLLILVLAYPILYTVRISASELDLRTFGPSEFVGLKYYVEAMQNGQFLNSLRVTGIYLVLALPLQIVLGFGIAYLINAKWRGRGVVRALFLIPMVVAPVVAGGIWKMLLNPLWGVVNFVLGLVGVPPIDWLGNPVLAMISLVMIDTWRWTPFITLIASAALLSLPKDIFEAAAVDGATRWRTLTGITLPLLAPMIAATFVVRWLGAVKMFDIALAATGGGPGRATSVVNLYIYEEAFRSLKFPEASAMSLIVLVITMVLTAVFLRISRGLEARW